ncbi:hypothetical protein HDV63DRAFT_372501 [Trichoderma sp. SZMC 28014]
MSSRENGLAAAHQANAIAAAQLTEKEAKEIAEYEKILRFRDAVLAGEHPTIKVEGNVALSSKANTRAPPERTEVDVKSHAPKSSFASTQKQNPSLPPHLADAGAKPADYEISRSFGGAGAGVGATTTQINPIFLEKSDQLVRAEIQLQRQRLERALREELENHRNTRHAEPVIDFDLPDVLAKALTLVQASATPFAANRGLTANSASDSFDDRTFYSSQHETPDSNLTSRVRRSTDEGTMTVDGRSESQSGPREAINSGSQVAAAVRDYPAAGSSSQPFHQAPAPAANATPSRPEKQQVPGLHHLHIDSGSLPVTHAPAIAAIATGVEANQTAERGHQGPGNGVSEPVQNQSGQPLPPLIRNHDLIPVAPQPAKISPLTVVNVQTPVVESVVSAPLAAPAQAQVAALRNEAPAAAVSDSSSQGTKEADQRKKKKKRKVERQAPEAEASPRIKVEPRSQSPVTAPAYTRPSKRQRQSQGHANESERPEPRHAQPPSNTSFERQPPQQVYRGERAPATYQAPEPRRIILRHAQGTEPATALNYDREFIDDRLASGESFIRLPHSSEHYVRRDYGRETDALDRARHGTIVREPYVISEGPYREPARVYHEPLEAPRASVRPEGESFIVPPRPPTRVMVDSYGREYIEPTLSSSRQSVAPLPRSGPPEVIYERLPPTQSLPGHPGAGVSYNESGVVYTRPLSVYDPVNRVFVSHPPEPPYDQRDGQYREHQLQQRGYIQLSGPHDRRIVEERPIEYASRPVGYQASDRVRLEPTGQPYYRMHSIHPDVSGREATSASALRYNSRHPDGSQPYIREYVGSPMQRHPTVHREYSVRPSERYQGPPAPARGSNEIAFIEQPRAATREIVYVDDVRREVYR